MKHEHSPMMKMIAKELNKNHALSRSATTTCSVSKLDQAALNTVAADMRKTAMKYVNDKDNARLMRAGELLAKAIEKDASRIGAKGLMKSNVRGEPRNTTEKDQDENTN